jgi:hypothetical protein
MADFIFESGIQFVADNTFRIEASTAYKGLGGGIKTVEFVRRKDNALMFVEAKKTFPNPAYNGEQFETQSTEIADKFIHSLNLYAAIALGVQSDEISVTNNATDKNTTIVFVLVIRNHKIEWCKQVRKKLLMIINECAYFRKIWHPELFVINYDMAIKYGLA